MKKKGKSKKKSQRKCHPTRVKTVTNHKSEPTALPPPIAFPQLTLPSEPHPETGLDQVI